MGSENDVVGVKIGKRFVPVVDGAREILEAFSEMAVQDEDG